MKKTMKKTMKKIVTCVFAILLTFNTTLSVFATELSTSTTSPTSNIEYNADIITADGIITEFSQNSLQKVPNVLGGSITPQASSFKFTISNVGIDTIDSVTLCWQLYDDITDKLLITTQKTFTNVKVGNTTYTWSRAKSDTVQERLELWGYAKDGSDSLTIKTVTNYRWNFVGGKYGSIKALGGQRHHMPSDSVSPLSTNNGPCIRMLTADHKKTSSYGSSTSAVNFRKKEKAKIDEGKFLAAQQLGINDVKSLFGSTKYSNAISQMVTYTKSLGYTQ